MDEAETDVLAYMGFPPQHRIKLHSTNPLERLNGEPTARRVGLAHPKRRLDQALVDRVRTLGASHCAQEPGQCWKTVGLCGGATGSSSTMLHKLRRDLDILWHP